MKAVLLLTLGIAVSAAGVRPTLAQANPRTFHKTPDGVAVLVTPGDAALAPPAAGGFGFGIKPDPAIVQAAAQLIDDSLTAMSTREDDKDTQWYDNGVWHNTNENVWQSQSGPALAAAVLWKWREGRKATLDVASLARQEWLRKVAMETLDHHIRERQRPDGSFEGTATHAQFFATDVALAYLTLGDTLDAATKTRWRDALIRVTDYWIGNGDLPDLTTPGWKATDGWTTNGNVEIYEAELTYLMAKVTGEERYRNLFEVQWKHTLLPSQERWKGYGLFYLKEPTRADGADGAGYLAEAEAEPGFDPEYTHLQLSDAARLYTVSGDPRVLRLVNVLLNALLPRVDGNTWILDATYGSRHSTRPRFFTSGPEVAAWLGGRADLVPKVPAHFEKALKTTYLHNARNNQGAPGLYRGYGTDPAVILMADMAAGEAYR